MKQAIVTSVFTIVISLAPSLFAQVGRDSGLWDWTNGAPHHESIVQITSGGGTGTGVVISVNKEKPIKDGYEGYCLTAWHVVQDDDGAGKVKVKYRNGRKAKTCRVVQYDKSKDIALLWIWVPSDIEPAKLAEDSIRGGDVLELAGLGGGSDLKCCIRHFSAVASPPSSGEKIFADVPLLPGDSGGPVFNEKHEVVGIISGGWFWWDGGVKTNAGFDIKTTWPARASNIGPIKVLMAKMQEESLTVDR